MRPLPPPPRVAGRPSETPRIEAGELRAGGWRGWWQRGGCRQSSSFTASLLLHFCLLLCLALVVRASRDGSASVGLVAHADGAGPVATIAQDPWNIDRLRRDQTEGDTTAIERPFEQLDVIRPQTHAAVRQHATLPLTPQSTRPTDLLMRTGAAVVGRLGGRGREARAALAGRDGGNDASERAVERGLRWLMAHQREDGSWSFDHHQSACRGQCRNPGTEASTTAATALVLLPFLGAGYTHHQGEYREVVGGGLYYLASRALSTPNGADLQNGTMYAQGLAAIALGEAYAMTGDRALQDLTQSAIDFVVYAQDKRGGGWRYTPGEPGDTTVTGWQLMGLKSGQMAGLQVPLSSIYLVRRFLDGVQSDEGAQYGYLTPQPRNSTTAIGLLCRMYTGWQRDHPALQRGVQHLSEWGPSQSNMYYNYYATQVMRHWEGPLWQQWNSKMRDHLIATQATASHEAGSWYFRDAYGDRGGRLYNTAMAVMTLEVYYRYMPLYGEDSVEGDF